LGEKPNFEFGLAIERFIERFMLDISKKVPIIISVKQKYQISDIIFQPIKDNYMVLLRDAKIYSSTIKEQVVEILRTQILNRVLMPGQQVNIDQIARELNVSPTPIKEALSILQTEGFITIKPRSGTFIAELNKVDLVETYEIRMALEIATGKKLVEVITPEGIRALEEALERIGQSNTANDERGEHLKGNVDFHELFVKLAGNNKMFEIYKNLNTFIQIYRVHYRSNHNWLNRIKKEREEHLKIIEGLRAKDSEKVITAVVAHLSRGLDSLCEDIALVKSE
jgi:GntR family transcriptional regulator, rspAB operon transcriptional repressor